MNELICSLYPLLGIWKALVDAVMTDPSEPLHGPHARLARSFDVDQLFTVRLCRIFPQITISI